MAGDSEIGTCDICKKEKPLSRKYYKYDIVCDCCNGDNDKHFDYVSHCNTCLPKPPRTTTVHIKPIK